MSHTAYFVKAHHALPCAPLHKDTSTTQFKPCFTLHVSQGAHSVTTTCNMGTHCHGKISPCQELNQQLLTLKPNTLSELHPFPNNTVHHRDHSLNRPQTKKKQRPPL